jgi:predicted MFS family arabinose efflux permease
LHRLGPTEAGLIGIPGAAGILVARPAGKWTDRAGPMPVVMTAVCVMLMAWVVLSAAGWSLAAVIAGVILLDCALRGAMVANQTLVNSAVPDSRSRANTLFGIHVWGGNATGAFLASTALAQFGWFGVCTVAITASSFALLIHFSAARRMAER